jgi:hypothetical protein
MATAQVEAKPAQQGGRVVKRWVAECDFTDDTGGCSFNEREGPELHIQAGKAIREAERHAHVAGHLGAREVEVRRTYKLEREEIVR